MTDTHPPESIARADRADLFLEALRQREPAEADLQASAMVMAGLKMLQQVRGTPEVLDILSRLGPALVAECPAPAQASEVARATAAASPAEELYAIVEARPAADGRMQADAMMTAATALLIAREGIEGAIAALGRVAERVRAVKPTPAVAPPQPHQAEDLVGTALTHLRALPVELAKAQARAAIVAANTFLGDVGAVPVVMVPGPALERTPAPRPEDITCGVVAHLRGLGRAEAHECARAVVAGSAAYLHEVFGRSYASALLADTLDGASRYGDEVRGGRDTLDMLH